MEGLVQDLTDWMLAIRPLWAYAIILLIAYGENVVPPIPGDLIVVFGGYLAGFGKLDLWLVVTLATVGGAAGFMTMYAIGYRIGDAVLDPERLRWLPKRRIGQARSWLTKYGYGVVAANRFLSGARSVISLTVGMAKMHAGHTLVFATLSALVWCALIAYGGYALGENWEVVVRYLRTYGQVILGVLLALALIQSWRIYRRRKRPREDSGDASRLD